MAEIYPNQSTSRVLQHLHLKKIYTYERQGCFYNQTFFQCAINNKQRGKSLTLSIINKNWQQQKTLTTSDVKST